MTCSPRVRRTWATWEPIKPAVPVTRMVIQTLLESGSRLETERKARLGVSKPVRILLPRNRRHRDNDAHQYERCEAQCSQSGANVSRFESFCGFAAECECE